VPHLASRTRLAFTDYATHDTKNEKIKFLKGVGKIFSKIFLTGVWGNAPQKNKRHKLTSFESGGTSD
jgi:hypothetical protein